MKWKKFKIKTVTDAEDIIISTLYDIGLEGAQIEDKVPLTAMEKEQMFVDILPDGPEDDGIAYLSFFVEEAEDGTLTVNGEEKTEEEILSEIRTLVSILPCNNEEDASYTECSDDLNRACSEIENATEDTAIALAEIADDHVFFETKKDFAKNMVTGFVKLNGMTVGAVANCSTVYDLSLIHI